jgi:hypothetical protein
MRGMVSLNVQAPMLGGGYFNIMDLDGGFMGSQSGQMVLNASHTYRLSGNVMAMNYGMGGNILDVTLSVQDLAPIGGGGGFGTPNDPFMPWEYAPPPNGQPPLPPEFFFPGIPIGDTGPGRSQFMFFDPTYATGYFVEVTPGGPKIAQLVLPDCGDGLYDLYSVDASGNKTLLQADLAAGTEFTLTTAEYKLFIDKIEESAHLDVEDPMAFQVGLIFDGSGNAEVTMTPVPEPATIALLLTAAIGGLLLWRRRA